MGFRPDIEGLRAVAVVAVVLYHAGIPGVVGGYIGVDVFFVISGFLITGLLWREVTTTRTVRLGRFYGARARRLLPAAATVGVATAIGAAALLPPCRRGGFSSTALPARCMSATTGSPGKAPITWPPTSRRRPSSTTGHWESRNSSTWFGRR
ncbi:hypothetical protein NIIDMKKI_66000 [Mycobacterium kansasii]|uniref:Acyltransferase 3 domain-containing protein n=1 Tax=Mycobacterium kansasii TaxID=1768 RepID=A0A7G1ILX8_MYCKA|nr:hypothetical protein NIIDMKKI_66000 [Mycobacterium kansasii]